MSKKYVTRSYLANPSRDSIQREAHGQLEKVDPSRPQTRVRGVGAASQVLMRQQWAHYYRVSINPVNLRIDCIYLQLSFHAQLLPVPKWYQQTRPSIVLLAVRLAELSITFLQRMSMRCRSASL